MAREAAQVDLTRSTADDVHGVMAGCRCAAIVASGTATLETAMLGAPHVIMYKLTPFERRLRDWLMIPAYIGQTNLLAGRELAPERMLLDDDVTPLVDATAPLLDDTPERAAMLDGIDALRRRLEGPGAIERAALHLSQRLRPGEHTARDVAAPRARGG